MLLPTRKQTVQKVGCVISHPPGLHVHTALIYTAWTSTIYTLNTAQVWILN